MSFEEGCSYLDLHTDRVFRSTDWPTGSQLEYVFFFGGNVFFRASSLTQHPKRNELHLHLHRHRHLHRHLHPPLHLHLHLERWRRNRLHESRSCVESRLHMRSKSMIEVGQRPQQIATGRGPVVTFLAVCVCRITAVVWVSGDHAHANAERKIRSMWSRKRCMTLRIKTSRRCT